VTLSVTESSRNEQLSQQVWADLSTFYTLWIYMYGMIHIYAKKLEFSTRVGTIVDRKKVLKQAGVVHNIKSQ